MPRRPWRNAEGRPAHGGRTGLDCCHFDGCRGAQFTLTADQAAATALYWVLPEP